MRLDEQMLIVMFISSLFSTTILPKITAAQVSSNTPVQTSNQDTSTACCKCVLSCSQSPTVVQSVDSSGSTVIGEFNNKLMTQ